MKSKKGIIITGIILASITAASFLAWIPVYNQGSNDATFVITNHRAYLDDVKSIHEVLAESTAIEFAMMHAGEITPAEYIARSEYTASQITMQIREFIASKPPEQWHESYLLYGEALRTFNSYVAETQVVASLIENENNMSDEQMQTLLENIKNLRDESDAYAKRSDATRPAQ